MNIFLIYTKWKFSIIYTKFRKAFERNLEKGDKNIILSKPYDFSQSELEFLPETNQPVLVTSVKLLELQLLQDQHL